MYLSKDEKACCTGAEGRTRLLRQGFASHDGHLLAGGRGPGRQTELAVFALVVSHKAFQVSLAPRERPLQHHLGVPDVHVGWRLRGGLS
jgi:hypothetical protein